MHNDIIYRKNYKLPNGDTGVSGSSLPLPYESKILHIENVSYDPTDNSLYGNNPKITRRIYDLENLREVIHSPYTQNLVKNRLMVGFYSHKSRFNSNRQEGYAYLDHNKEKILITIPSHVTTKLSVGNKNIAHTEEVMDTPTGKIVANLIKSKIGGWSSSANGIDGGSDTPSIVTQFNGFDYVILPGIPGNRNLQEAMQMLQELANQIQIPYEQIQEGIEDIKLEGFQTIMGSSAFKTFVNKEVQKKLTGIKNIVESAQINIGIKPNKNKSIECKIEEIINFINSPFANKHNSINKKDNNLLERLRIKLRIDRWKSDIAENKINQILEAIDTSKVQETKTILNILNDCKDSLKKSHYKDIPVVNNNNINQNQSKNPKKDSSANNIVDSILK